MTLVVTLPPGLENEAALAFARRARMGGANALELRTDFTRSVDAEALSEVVALLVAERGPPAPPSWLRHATWVDGVSPTSAKRIDSWHAPVPISPADAEAYWRPRRDATVQLKHVEPLGRLDEACRLLETQRRLEGLGFAGITVLATGPLALPFRALLAGRNHFDFVALDAHWSAAPGQRLLADAVRERRSGRGSARLGILGSAISGSRSPRVHRQPFDRIDLPEDAPVGALVEVLRPFYAGFAVTSPFKLRFGPLAVNTLLASEHGWDTANTDVEGARAVLARLEGEPVTLLGDGGATAALRRAAANRRLRVLRRKEASAVVSGPVVWTWPAHVRVSEGLRFENARVAVIAYGAAGRRVSEEVRRRGGQPLALGARWFIAQARGQRALWEGR